MPAAAAPIDAEVVPPGSGGSATPVFPIPRTNVGRLVASPQAAWFAWGFIVGAVAVGVFVWKTRERHRAAN